jgi:hypothetical protein
MAEVGLAEYFSMAEALGNHCNTVCDYVLLQEADAKPFSRYPNKGS